MAAALVFVVLVAVGVWFFFNRDDSSTRSAPVAKAVTARPHGGSVRVAVTSPPEMIDKGNGGDTLRQLVLPKLFVAQPDGTWRASLAAPGSDHTSKDALSATFRIRKDARWSNGTAITVDDLKRSADPKYVTSVDGGRNGSTVTVHFPSRMPGWRRLWSGFDSVSAPAPDVYGGPFAIKTVTSGLETVLTPNPGWASSAGGPFLDDIHLVLVADAVVADQLLATNQVDVVAPVGDTVRTPKLQKIDGVTVSTNDRSGVWVGLRVNSVTVNQTSRRRILAQFPRDLFVGSLMNGEATRLDDLIVDRSISATGKGMWSTGADPELANVDASSLSLTVPIDEPLGPLFQRTVDNALLASGAKATALRSVDAPGAADALKSGGYDLMMYVAHDGPDMCWTCDWADVDSSLAAKADGGDMSAARALESELRTQGLLLPLWRENAVVGYRTAAVSGVTANGFGSGPAWNANVWWRP